MISRSTLVGALVVVELAIVGLATDAVAGGSIFGTARQQAPPQFGLGGDSAGDVAGQLHRTFVAGLAPRIVVDVRDVDVVLQAGGGAAVRVDETLERCWLFPGGAIPPVTAQQSLDVVRVASSAPNDVYVHRHVLHITVPSTARIEFVSAGSVDVSGLRSKLVAHIPSGAIHLRDHRGDVDVSTGEGRITMIDVQGADIAANTRDGRIYLTRVGADRINAMSHSGRIVGVDVRAVDGTLTTRDGRVVLSFTGDSDAVVSARTEDGEVNVSGFPITQSGDQHSVLRVGSGRGHFDVSTSNGPITITPGASV